MPRRSKQPSYRCHKARNCAVVTIDGKNHYLGPYESPESYEKYARLIAELRARRSHAIPPSAKPESRQLSSVNEVLQAFWKHAIVRYVEDGKPTPEQAAFWSVIRVVQLLFGMTPVECFGPFKLKAVREHLIAQKLCRNEVNKRIKRIKHIFSWAVGEERIPGTISAALREVKALRYGDSGVREAAKVRSVADHLVDAVLPHVSRPVAAMIELQRLTGMRPGEVVIMRAIDIDRTCETWVYEPTRHKNSWRGHRRLIPLGPSAQKVIKPFLDRPAQAYLFSPAEAEAERSARRRQNRCTKMTPSQAKRHNKANPKRAKRDRYDRDSYRRAITYAIQRTRRLGIEVGHWHPHQLRHSHATKVRKLYGVEGAQLALGHASVNVTEIYAEKNLQLAAQIAKEMG